MDFNNKPKFGTVKFPPDFDGQLNYEAEERKYSTLFHVEFNRKPNETAHEGFLRMCKEVTEGGK